MEAMIGLTLWSVGLSSVMTVLSKVLTNQKELKKIKNEMQFFKEKMEKSRKSGDTAKAEQFMNDMLKSSNKQLKQTMKPLFISMIIFFTAFQFLGATYSDIVISLPFAFPFLGTEINWFWWYLIVVMPSSMLLRKFFDVQ
jgi:uncharacterized membrane protein (DUF106 family)